MNKPVALITAATGGSNAHASLLLTLTALSAIIPEDSKLLLPFIRAKINPDNEVRDTATLAAVYAVAESLIECIDRAVS